MRIYFWRRREDRGRMKKVDGGDRGERGNLGGGLIVELRCGRIESDSIEYELIDFFKKGRWKAKNAGIGRLPKMKM